MKRTALATLGITLGFAAMIHPAFAQSTPERTADFGPPPPATATMQDPGLNAPAMNADVQAAPPAATVESSPPPVVEQARPAYVQEVPATPAVEASSYPTTRNAAPDRSAPRHEDDPNPQTGPYLGHGLFNNWGPNDFGA